MIISSSMLPVYSDCSRKAAAGQFKKQIEEAGFILNSSKKGIYTSIGTAVHAANQYMLKNKIEYSELPNVKTCIDFGIESFKGKLVDVEDIVHDDTTPNINHAFSQISIMVRFYHSKVAPKMLFPDNIDPGNYLEKELRAEIRGHTKIGHVDVITKNSICDTKSGSSVRPCHTQLGDYANLAVSNGYEIPKKLWSNILPRAKISKIYPGVTNIPYDVNFCMAESWAVTNKIIDDFEAFKKTNNPASFTANPQSNLCSIKYCKAYNTKFCGYYHE